MVDVTLGAEQYDVQIGDEVVQVTMNVFEGAAGSVDDKTVKITASDALSGYLSTKVVAGTNMAVTVLDAGSIETLEIASTIVDTDDLSEGSINLYYTEARVSANTDVAASTVHLTSNGSDHTFIDQDVTLISSPTFVEPIVDAVQLDITATPLHAEGKIHFNSDLGMPEVGSDDADIHLFWNEGTFKIKNTSGAIITELTAVHPTGSSGDNPTVGLASASSFDTSRPVGLIRTESIADNGVGFVTIIGRIQDVDTSAWSDGDKLYLSSVPGQLVTSAPAYPNYPVRIGVVVRSHATEGIVIVDSDPEYDLNQALNIGASPNFSAIKSTNDLSIECGTEKTLVLTEAVWDDMRTPINNTKAIPGKQPTEFIYKNGIVYEFSNVLDNGIAFNVQLPHDYKEGTDIDFHIHYFIKTNGLNLGAENVKWDFTHSWGNILGSQPSATAVTQTIDVQSLSTDTHYLGEIVETISGVSKNISSMLICSLTRDVSVTNNYGDGILLMEVDFHYQKDTLGSRQETSK